MTEHGYNFYNISDQVATAKQVSMKTTKIQLLTERCLQNYKTGSLTHTRCRSRPMARKGRYDENERRKR